MISIKFAPVIPRLIFVFVSCIIPRKCRADTMTANIVKILANMTVL